MRQGLDESRAARAGMWRPYFLSFLAQIYGVVGEADEALRVVDEALTLVASVGVRAWEAELYRLKGDLLRAQSAAAEEIEEHFQRALDVARAQKAKSLELRATMSLCRLWQTQGKSADAQQLLEGIYDWFGEGFETADLQEAHALQEELGKAA